LMSVEGLEALINQYHGKQDNTFKLFLMEFALHGLAEFSMLSKKQLSTGLQFKDLLSSMFSMPKPGDEDDDE
jgi:magnesium chelatase subunit I